MFSFDFTIWADYFQADTAVKILFSYREMWKDTLSRLNCRIAQYCNSIGDNKGHLEDYAEYTDSGRLRYKWFDLVPIHLE